MNECQLPFAAYKRKCVCVSVRVGVYSMFICSFLSNFQLHGGNVCVHRVYTLHTLDAEHTYMVSLAAREDRCWSYISKTFDFSSYYFNRQWDEHNNKVGLSMKQSNANQVLSKALHLFNAQPNKTTWAELKCSLSLSLGRQARFFFCSQAVDDVSQDILSYIPFSLLVFSQNV